MGNVNMLLGRTGWWDIRILTDKQNRTERRDIDLDYGEFAFLVGRITNDMCYISVDISMTNWTV